MADRRYQAAVMRQRDEWLMTNRAPIPRRITTALDMMGLWGPEVDHALGVEEPTVDQWETGELVPTRDQIAALSLLTGVRPNFFYTDVEPVPVWLCGDDGCHLVAPSNYEPEPTAEVLWLPTPNALF